MHPAGISYLRRLYLAAEPRNSRRALRHIYIDRRGSLARGLSNEDEIVDVLVERGFACVRLERLAMSEQARLFQDAEIVIAPHGAGLANMVFAAPGLRVIELIPDGVMNWCYRHLAAASGHEYDCVIGRSAPSPGQSTSRLWSNWTVSATHVLSSVEHNIAAVS